jgi:phosphatidylserine/phosphatidylglycerophosphate/cardiolipin synthase-like enzyme
VEARAQGVPAGSGLLIDLRTLTDGGQTADEIARAVAGFLEAAERTLDLALYDIRLHSPVAEIVRGALVRAADRGVAVRLAYNVDHPGPGKGPPPPKTEPGLIESLPLPTRAIPGVPDLMHHKYVIRDGAAVWTGSTNWTDDSWTREENVIVTVDSPELARAYAKDFEQLWRTRDVARSGRVSTEPVRIGDVPVRPWFCPGRGERLAHRIAKAIGCATRRVRIASPVITSGPILGTLAQKVADARVDVAGVVDQTQIHEVLGQWKGNGTSAWKEAALRAVLGRRGFTGKRSTPYAPGAVHDYMHAKTTICDDVVFVGSFNLSHSGEENAENVLEIGDRDLADELAEYVDEVRARYAAVELPA